MHFSTRTAPWIRAFALSAALAAGAMPAAAGSFLHDEVHADSFGNLVIYSPSGYKRIVVGQGHLAAELQAYSGGEADDGYGYGEPSGDDRHLAGDCGRHGVLLRGRGYMYGLPDNVMPNLRRFCR